MLSKMNSTEKVSDAKELSYPSRTLRIYKTTDMVLRMITKHEFKVL